MKKRFPRFSLRALMIAVLAVAVCWTLTATWGISTLFNKYGTPAYLKREQTLNTLRFIRNDDSGVAVYESKMQATAIVPFYVRVTGSVRMPDDLNGDYVETYLWFFGALWKLNGLPEVIQKR